MYKVENINILHIDYLFVGYVRKLLLFYEPFLRFGEPRKQTGGKGATETGTSLR